MTVALRNGHSHAQSFISWPPVKELVGQRALVYRRLIFIDVELEQRSAQLYISPFCATRVKEGKQRIRCKRRS